MSIEQLIQQAVEAIKAGSFDITNLILIEALSIARSQGDRPNEIKSLH